MYWIESKSNDVLLRLKVIPNAKKSMWDSEIIDGFRKIRIATPPVEGAANKALILFLSKCLKIKQSQIEIVSGEKSRQKCILLKGATVSEVQSKIEL